MVVYNRDSISNDTEITIMNIVIREFKSEDTADAAAIWNEVVDEGVAFPQLDYLDGRTGMDFFLEQSFTGVACDDNGQVVGLYILHPNNVGRCGHICNASYAVRASMRGRGIGQKLVAHCLEKAAELGFRILQFNAVVANNTPALSVYKKLGFVQIGTIPGGFLMKDGSYQDITVHYHLL